MLHILTDTPNPAFQVVELKLALRGIAHLNPHTPKQDSPITPTLLMAMYSNLDMSNPQDMTF